MEHIVAVRTGGVAQIDDRHMVAVMITGNGAVIAIHLLNNAIAYITIRMSTGDSSETLKRYIENQG